MYLTDILDWPLGAKQTLQFADLTGTWESREVRRFDAVAELVVAGLAGTALAGRQCCDSVASSFDHLGVGTAVAGPGQAAAFPEDDSD